MYWHPIKQRIGPTNYSHYKNQFKRSDDKVFSNVFSKKLSKKRIIQNQTEIRKVIDHLNHFLLKDKFREHVENSDKNEDGDTISRQSISFVRKRTCVDCGAIYSIKKQLGKFNCSRIIQCPWNDDKSKKTECIHNDYDKDMIIDRNPIGVSLIHCYIESVNVPRYNFVEKIILTPEDNNTGNIDMFKSFI